MARVLRSALFFTVMIHCAFSSRLRSHYCVKVPEMCHKLISDNYTHMRLPNMLNHTRKEDVAGDLSLWNPLLQSKKCNAGNQLKYFLCFTYAPVCVEDTTVNKLIPPCKSMCQSVRQSCEPVMKRHNYSWPQVFNCDQKYRFLDDETQMCISSRILAGIQKTNTKKTSQAVHQDKRCSCKKEYKESRLKSMICRSHFVLRGRLISKPKVTKLGSGLLEIELMALRVMHMSKENKPNIVKKGAMLKMTVFNKKHNCRCQRLKVKKRTRGNGQYFVIGRKLNGELQVDAIAKWRDIPHLKNPQIC